jgi:lactoylglutathione lyase
MRIEHVALWVKDLERMRRFYVDLLGGCSGPEYLNAGKGFRSYFIGFAGGARLELMTSTNLDTASAPGHVLGYAHVALAVGSRERVDSLTAELHSRGVKVVGEPRTTGDGYYESQVADPEGNLIEITV